MTKELKLPVPVKILADRDIPECPGLYSLSCGGKYYVGSSQNLRMRFRRHISLLRSGVHYNKPFQEAVKQGGVSFCVLQYYDEISVAAQYREEQSLINAFTLEGIPLFNISPYSRGGGGALSDNGREVLRATGRRLKSQETRDKLAQIRRGGTLPMETRQKISLSLLGNTRAKGLVHNIEARKKMSIAHSRTHSIYGIIYQSASEVRAALQLHKSTLSRRLHSRTALFSEYLLVSDDGYLYKPICKRDHWRNKK